MKIFKQKNKMQPSTASATTKGPDEEKIKAIIEKTGYTLDVTTGQRKYGGPPPDWEGPQPGSGCEVFCGKIPKDMFEDELIPLFEKCGRIWDLRLMMDPATGQNRGYAFVTFCDKEGAQQGVKQLDNHEIKDGKTLKVNISVPNLRLFVGNIPKNKSKEDIHKEFSRLTAELTEVIIYSSPDDKKKNRGFCFLEYQTHKAASLAKRRLGIRRLKVWGSDIIVDWADPQEEPDEQTMAKVKVLYVRNLTSEVTEEKLKETFEPFGKIERIKKVKDYGFIHFEEHDDALKATNALNNKDLCGAEMQIALAKPPSDKKRKEKQMRDRERRMMAQQRQEEFYGRVAMHGLPGRDDYDYDYYGYGDYRGGYADPYYDEYYGIYDDYGYGSGHVVPPRGRARGGTAGAARGRGGPAARGRAGGPPSRGGRGGNASRARGRGRGGATQRGRGNLAGKRKFDGGHQNQGDSKRRFQNQNYNQPQQDWGTEPIAQQPLESSGSYGWSSGGGGGGVSDEQWYQDTY